MTKTFSLQEIADWQLNSENSKVELPSIQRGFVWKPKQIEDLWDSILRGYPIGSFLFSKTGDKLYLMDGQQRATSIFLGYFDPFNPNGLTKAWAIKGELPVVWIDLKPKTKPDTSKYLIRLTTNSHPWGYQSSFNDKKLSTSDRRKALELFKQHPENKGGYTSFKNSTIFPFDCNCPLPLSFFINAMCIEDIIENVEKNLPNYFSTKGGGFKNKKEFTSLLKTELHQELVNVFEIIKKRIELKIISNVIDDEVLHEKSTDENPTLFVRTNSSGTTLTGDDLIYSIYKSIFPEAKNLIENIGINFITPTQVLSIVSRIVASDLENTLYVKKMNVRDFQRRIRDEEFKGDLRTLIESNEIEALFKHAIDILSCKHNSLLDGEIPPVIIKHFIKRDQDLFLFFVYWLHVNKMSISEKMQLKMVAKIFSFAWFDFSNVPLLWKENITNQSFWDEPLNELFWWNGEHGIHFLIKPQLLRDYYSQSQIENLFKTDDKHKWGLWEEGVGKNILHYYNQIKPTQDISLEIANRYFWEFIGKIQHNKQLVLFAQRNYINSTFKEFNQMDEIEDTNAPWDWDHIYPSEWVYRKVYCNRAIKDWNNTNGNFRAISLEHNRSRGNKQSPKNISEVQERDFSFILENDWEFWQNIDDRIYDDNIHCYFQAIMTRMINIYQKFWDDFKINDLIV